MRSPLPARRAGLSVVAALVLLPGCSGSDDESSASAVPSSASATPSAAESSGSGFCTEAASIQERLEATVISQSDPTQLPQILDEAATEIRAVEAPAEIAADWTALADGVERFADAIAGIDFTGPDALAALERQLAPVQQELGTASTNVTEYLREECGIDVGATEPATPTT